MTYLDIRVLLRLNYLTVKAHGGNYQPPDNLLNSSPLHYLIEIIDASLFGEPMYPEIWDKAGLYMHSIISNHIFSDGNKRTGLGAALLFLALNGFELRQELHPAGLNIPASDRLKHLEIFTLLVASGKVDLAGVQNWFRHNAVPK